MMVYFYLTIEQAIEIHALTLAKSGGGIQGILNIGYLKSALDHIQNDEFYPTMEKKLTHLFFALASSTVSRMETNGLPSLCVPRCCSAMVICIVLLFLSAMPKILVTMSRREKFPRNCLGVGWKP